MTQIDVYEDVAAFLSAEAESRGCDKAQLASVLLQQGLEMQKDFQLSTEDDAMLRQRLANPQDGAYMTSEEVDVKFEALFTRLRAR